MLCLRFARLFAAAFAGAALCFAIAAVAHDTTPRASAAGDCSVDASLDADELAFLTLINNYRAQNGLAPLKVSYTLSRASAWKSKDMATNAYFAHDDLSRTWVQRVRDCSYGFNAYIGENIAAGYPNAQAVFDGWKASPGHNANMLGANYTAIGIGKYVKSGSPYGTYWTTDFGSFSDGWVDALNDGPAPIIATPSPVASPTPIAASPTPTRPNGRPPAPGHDRRGHRTPAPWLFRFR